MQTFDTARPDNRLLAALPNEEWDLLASHVRYVDLPYHETLCEADGVVLDVWFPTSGAISCVTVLAEGGSIESNLVGREGAVGVSGAYGFPRSPWRLIVQMPGTAAEISTSVLNMLLPQLPVLGQSLFQHAHECQHVASQTVACNRFHPVAERLARWLLTMLDRADGMRLVVTHEFLGQMLGAHRPTVTIALGTLSRAGIIEPAHRGQVIVISREALEDAACECYAATAIKFRNRQGAAGGSRLPWVGQRTS